MSSEISVILLPSKKKIDVVSRYEVFMATRIQVEVFWFVTACGVVVGRRSFGGPCCLQI